VYYNYYKRNNDSTDVTRLEFGRELRRAAAERPLRIHEEQFRLDAYWRFLPNNRLGGGWDYWDIKQNRTDYDKVTTNRLFVEWKNTSLPQLSGRLKYTYFQRRSNFLLGDAGVDANDPEFIQRFTSRFDLSDLNRNEVKLIADWSPAPMLDFSLEATWKDNDYRDIVLGPNFRPPRRHLSQRVVGRSLTGPHHRFRRLRADHLRFGSPADRREPVQYLDRPELLRSEHSADVVRVQLVGEQPRSQLGYRRRLRLARDGALEVQGVDPLLRDRRIGGHRQPEQLRQSAADHRLRRHEANLAQPEGDLRLRQELVVHSRLLLRAVALQ
jgi:hypothetical protein